jgi:anaerobic selenocysteine-containing dehydrogenase
MKAKTNSKPKEKHSEKVVKSTCRMCHGVCGVLVHIKGGKVVALSPWYKVPRLVPDDMIKQGLFKDETINIHYLPVK